MPQIAENDQVYRLHLTKRTPVLPRPKPVRGVVHVRVERCKGCALCVEYCPTRVLDLSAEFNPKGYHYPIVINENCISCQACYTICPEFAIFATPSFPRGKPSEAVLAP